MPIFVRGRQGLRNKCLPFLRSALVQFWRGLSALPLRLFLREPLRRRDAHIARSTGLPLWRLAEVGAYLQMAARLPFNKLPDLVIALPRALFLQRISDLIDEVCQQSYITLLPQQDAIGGQSITPCAASFLVVLL